MAVDLVLRNGRIVDGSGLPSYIGDVAIQDGKVTEIGAVTESARRVIDCSDRVVAPGFIDPHTHYDAQLLWDPAATSSCFHGVTSLVMGNCSLTLHPCKEADRDALISSLARVEAIPRAALEEALQWEWTSTGEYLDRLGQGLGVNVAAHIGHSALRQFVMGEAATERAASPDEIAAMREALRQSLLEGAIGFSVNQNPMHIRDDNRPIPSRLGTHQELLALASVLRELNAGVIQISRGPIDMEPEGQVAILERYKEIALTAGRPLTWNSIIHRWPRPDAWREVLDHSGVIAAEGVPMYGLGHAQPINQRFTLKNAQMFDGMPNWDTVIQAPVEQRADLFRDPAVRERLRADLTDPTPRLFSKRWDTVHLNTAAAETNRHWEGQTVQQIADQLGKDPLDTFLDLALAEDLDTEFMGNLTNGDLDAAAEILRRPYVMIGASDAGAHTTFDAGYGYCTAVLGHWVRERGILTLEQAVSRLTLQPARFFGFDDRGLLRPGMAGDVVVFDPATVRPGQRERAYDYPAGQWRWIQPAVGVSHTIVNGQILVEDGRLTEVRSGQVLRNARARQAALA